MEEVTVMSNNALANSLRWGREGIVSSMFVIRRYTDEKMKD